MATNNTNIVPPLPTAPKSPTPRVTEPKKSRLGLILVSCMIAGVALGVVVYQQSIAPKPTTKPISSAQPVASPIAEPVSISQVTQGTMVRFGVVGDYGNGSPESLRVAQMLASLNPDIILTTGDNNYPDGGADTIDDHVGKLYSNYIYPYKGKYGSTATVNRFFPAPGNHDWHAPNLLKPYIDYFTLPGNERYYDFVWGPVHFFVLDSDPAEPDGAKPGSIQAQWLEQKMKASTSKWQLVFMHHAPYSSSSLHGSRPAMQWAFEAWGADAVFAGHDHLYERLKVGTIPYFVNGSGGPRRYQFGTPLPQSIFRNNTDTGAMLVEATESKLTFNFYNMDGKLIDSSTHDGSASTFNPSPGTVMSPSPSKSPIASMMASSSPAASKSPSPSKSPTASKSPSPAASSTTGGSTMSPTPSKSPVASKSPAASMSPSPVAQATTPTPTPRAAMPEASSLPDAGIFEVTAGTVSLGLLFIVLGALGLLML